jgi:AcrR family transcriptional regulator
MPGSRDRIGTFYQRFLRKTPQQPRSRSVVDALLVAALDRIARADADDSFTVNEVAKGAGVATGSIYDYFTDRTSLLSAATTKIAADNLADFEAILGETNARPVREAVERIVDFAFTTYLADVPKMRALTRLTMRLGHMSTLANGQALFAEALAKSLSARPDVRVTDPEHASWVVTQAVMGAVGTLMWDEAAPDHARVRHALVAMIETFLTRSVAP